jgi:hypothetical protein
MRRRTQINQTSIDLVRKDALQILQSFTSVLFSSCLVCLSVSVVDLLDNVVQFFVQLGALFLVSNYLLFQFAEFFLFVFHFLFIVLVRVLKRVDVSFLALNLGFFLKLCVVSEQ